jgi:hypothetical protein
MHLVVSDKGLTFYFNSKQALRHLAEVIDKDVPSHADKQGYVEDFDGHLCDLENEPQAVDQDDVVVVVGLIIMEVFVLFYELFSTFLDVLLDFGHQNANLEHVDCLIDSVAFNEVEKLHFMTPVTN